MSDIIIFNKKNPIITDITIGSITVKTKTEMKVLGMIFDAQLKLETHVTSVIAKCNSKVFVLRRISSNLTNSLKSSHLNI